MATSNKSINRYTTNSFIW